MSRRTAKGERGAAASRAPGDEQMVSKSIVMVGLAASLLVLAAPASAKAVEYPDLGDPEIGRCTGLMPTLGICIPSQSPGCLYDTYWWGERHTVC